MERHLGNYYKIIIYTLFTSEVTECLNLRSNDGIPVLLFSRTLFDILVNLISFSLVGLYGISTIVGYLMPNPVFRYILDV